VSSNQEEETRVKLACAALLVTVPALAAAQPGPPPPSPARIDAMKKIEFMLGTWKGDGWMQMGPQKHTFASSETVSREVDGLALVIKGLHTSEGRLVHNALGVLSANDDGSYAFHAWLANGRGGVYKGEWKDGAFVWGMDTPVGKMRYTIRLDPQGRWFEKGEMSRDGSGWTVFFEMTLSKAS
jgi:hypothetical protein